MSDREIFPMLDDGSTHDEPWDHRFAPLAAILGCSIDEAANAFFGLEFPEYVTREHLNAVQDSIERQNRALKPAEKLLYQLQQLTHDELAELRRQGAVTVEQIEHLADVLSGEVAGLKGWYSRQDRRGGRVVAAHIVAEAVRRAFRRQRARVTYGESDGRPTTLFGRAVEQTIAAFGIRADWADPAHKAWQRHRGYERRLARMKLRQSESK